MYVQQINQIYGQSKENEIREISLTIDACGYTRKGLRREKEKGIKVKAHSNRLDKWYETKVTFISCSLF